MSARDDLDALVDRLPEASLAAAAAYLRGLLAEHARAAAPQWGEAYQLFDGAYLSLDDILDTGC